MWAKWVNTPFPRPMNSSPHTFAPVLTQQGAFYFPTRSLSKHPLITRRTTRTVKGRVVSGPGLTLADSRTARAPEDREALRRQSGESLAVREITFGPAPIPATQLDLPASALTGMRG